MITEYYTICNYNHQLKLSIMTSSKDEMILYFNKQENKFGNKSSPTGTKRGRKKKRGLNNI